MGEDIFAPPDQPLLHLAAMVEQIVSRLRLKALAGKPRQQIKYKTTNNELNLLTAIADFHCASSRLEADL